MKPNHMGVKICQTMFNSKYFLPFKGIIIAKEGGERAKKCLCFQQT
jgi:hypothetical protein